MENTQLTQQHVGNKHHQHRNKTSIHLEKHKRPQNGELILIRGLPGSGKTTMAEVLKDVGYEHFEADMYFMQDGTYLYDPTRIRDAHAWCQNMTRKSLNGGMRVVVSNTFTRLSEMAPYYTMTRDIKVIEAKGKWPNSHGVSADKLALMASRWEPTVSG